MFELELLDENDQPRGAHPVAARPLYVGRSPRNDVVVLDGTVSARHLALWCTGEAVFVEDLHSRNGTFVGDDRIRGTHRLRPGDVVRAGTGTRLRVRRVEVASVPPGEGVLVLEDVEAGLRYPLPSDRFRIGSGQGADLYVRDAEAQAAILLVHDNGEVWLGRDDDLQELTVGDTFDAAGRRYALRRVSDRVSVTREVDATRYPYVLRASVEAATLEDEHTGKRITLTGETRAVLLYLLARQWRQDLERGLGAEVAGWCDDHDVSVGIWGKGDVQPNKLNVLVCRVRKELREAGFDPWFVEKRRGAVRARVSDAEVA